jgi:hypothetical protein
LMYALDYKLFFYQMPAAPAHFLVKTEIRGIDFTNQTPKPAF